MYKTKQKSCNSLVKISIQKKKNSSLKIASNQECYTTFCDRNILWPEGALLYFYNITATKKNIIRQKCQPDVTQ